MAVFAIFAASLAHTVGGGAPPGPVALMVALAFSVPLAMALSGARARLARTAVSALVAQAALHLTYAMGGATPLASTMHAGHHHAGLELPAPPVAAVDHGNAWMPAAHLVAAAITLAALVLADRIADTIGGAVRVLVRRLTRVPTPVVAPTLRIPVDGPRPRLVGALLHAAMGSRGPPAVAAAA
ncbi:hypothetical protein EV187_2825 [Agromyces ramosus]|uniref:Uncharacterized protein n=1 Tax=Agromyces ramosus TaxID=33879 RepID=A0A4Q7MC51_9MICO|nr:hypothetical protein EV187_2825 [Agromyces ramosus]